MGLRFRVGRAVAGNVSGNRCTLGRACPVLRPLHQTPSPQGADTVLALNRPRSSCPSSSGRSLPSSGPSVRTKATPRFKFVSGVPLLNQSLVFPEEERTFPLCHRDTAGVLVSTDILSIPGHSAACNAGVQRGEILCPGPWSYSIRAEQVWRFRDADNEKGWRRPASKAQESRQPAGSPATAMGGGLSS